MIDSFSNIVISQANIIMWDSSFKMKMSISCSNSLSHYDIQYSNHEIKVCMTYNVLMWNDDEYLKCLASMPMFF